MSMFETLKRRGQQIIFSSWKWSEPMLERVEKVHPALGPVAVLLTAIVAGGVFYGLIDMFVFVLKILVGFALSAAFFYSLIRWMNGDNQHAQQSGTSTGGTQNDASTGTGSNPYQS
jgi:hypothetical protein